jgi:hypothetical protein
MGEMRLEFMWPSLLDAIPALLIFVVMPAWLVGLIFKYTSLSRWKKAILLPAGVIAPFLVTALWPFALKASGIIKFTGPEDYQPSYSWYAQELFGRFSDYVWVSLTALAILALRGLLKSKATRRAEK